MSMSASLKQEEEAFNAVRCALRDAHHLYTKGTQPVSAADQQPLTTEQCVQLLDVYLKLILETSDDVTSYVLSRTFQTEFFSVICRYVFQPLVFSPNATTGYAAQQSFLELRAAAAKVMNHILVRSTSIGSEGIASSCFRCILDLQVLDQLMAVFGNAAVPEVIRCAIAEASFIFILRFGVEGQTAFVQTKGVSVTAGALVVDSSTVVRNYCGSILRELSVSMPDAVSNANTLSVCLKVMCSDRSSDVQILACETIQECLRASPESRFLVTRPHELLNAIGDRLFRNLTDDLTQSQSQSPQRHSNEEELCVKEAVCKLLQISCLVAASMCSEDFFDICTQMGFAAKLSQMVGGGSTLYPSASQPSTFAVKRIKMKTAVTAALRCIIQYTSSRFFVGAQVIENFQSLSSLLKAAIDAGKYSRHADDASRQGYADMNPSRVCEEMFSAYCVELAVAIALILCQSSRNRSHIQHELRSVPMWATTLKASLIECLNQAAMDFFGTVDIIDVTGVVLNALEGVEWSEANKPRRHSITSVFARQEERVDILMTSPNANVKPPQIPPSMIPSRSESDMARRQRLTLVLLNYAIHLALTPVTPEMPAEPSLVQVSQPGTTTPLRSDGANQTPRQSGAPNSFVDPSAASMNTPARQRQMTPARGAAPNFPNVGSSPAVSQRAALSANEREALAVAFDKFNSSFQLTLQLAELYCKKKRDEAMFVPTNDGFAVRAQKLKNPWGPLVQKPSLRSWTVKDVQDGDLFYFAIPFDDLNERSIGIVMERGRRHMAFLKRSVITTPQTAKGRRWFLYDSLNFVLPRCLAALEEMMHLATNHGDANLRFPVFLFREKEMHLGERCLHPGNLLEVLDQVKFYFQQNPAELFGGKGDDKIVASLQKQIEGLKGRRFGGDETVTPDGSDDEDGGFRGHGGISSESEGENFNNSASQQRRKNVPRE